MIQHLGSAQDPIVAVFLCLALHPCDVAARVGFAGRVRGEDGLARGPSEYFFFCASLPPSLIGVAARLFALMLVAMPEHPYASSSVMNVESRSLRPWPPYASGRVGVTSPSFHHSSNTSFGNFASRSQAAATGDDPLLCEASRHFDQGLLLFGHFEVQPFLAASSSIVQDVSASALLERKRRLFARALSRSCHLGSHASYPEDVPGDESDKERPGDEKSGARRALSASRCRRL